AQNLDRSAFHWLVELEMGGAPGRAPLKVCLVGQPELRALVESGDLLALRERVSVSCHLGPLGLAETGAYIRHRLVKVGWTGSPSFDEAAFREIHRWTQGIPRRINLLCNRLMLSRFLTAQVQIDAKAVEDTARDLRAEIGEAEPAPPPVLHEAAPPPLPPALPAPLPVLREAVAPPTPKPAPAAPPTSAPATSAAAIPAVEPVLPAIPVMPRVRGGGESRPLLCVVGGQGDHVKAAALMRALAARPGLPVTLLVRCYANNAFERHRDMFSGVDVAGRLISLGIAGGTYAGRAAELMKRFEFVVDHCLPAAVIVFDGSDAALACGLVASRKEIPVLHVGAGLRGQEQAAAADITRRLVDQLADVLYTADAQANELLVHEGVVKERICFVGNLLADSLQTALRSKLGVPS
ncbi:MAG: UDP-N-acetylglucosamine 2-epimerase, partial [Rhizobacter sp.]